MKNGMIVLIWLLAACTSGVGRENNVVVFKKDTSIIDPKAMNGLWLESKGRYESSFIFIDNETVYLLKGPAEEYFISHDTFQFTSGGRFRRKITELDSVHIKWKTNSGETYTFYKKNLK